MRCIMFAMRLELFFLNFSCINFFPLIFNRQFFYIFVMLNAGSFHSQTYIWYSVNHRPSLPSIQWYSTLHNKVSVLQGHVSGLVWHRVLTRMRIHFLMHVLWHVSSISVATRTVQQWSTTYQLCNTFPTPSNPHFKGSVPWELSSVS